MRIKREGNVIELSSYWGIGSDIYNIILYHKVKKGDKEPRWVVEGFYSGLHDTLKGMVDQDIRDPSLKTLKELTEKIDLIYDMIKNIPQIRIADLRK